MQIALSNQNVQPFSHIYLVPSFLVARLLAYNIINKGLKEIIIIMDWQLLHEITIRCLHHNYTFIVTSCILLTFILEYIRSKQNGAQIHDNNKNYVKRPKQFGKIFEHNLGLITTEIQAFRQQIKFKIYKSINLVVRCI